MTRIVPALLLALLPLAAEEEPLRVCATTTDAASLAMQLGGRHVSVTTLTRVGEDPRRVVANPEYVDALRSTDLLVLLGRGTEERWLPPLVERAERKEIAKEGPLRLDLDAGNLLDPEAGRAAARRIVAALAKARPSRRADFESALEEFERELGQKLETWQTMLKPMEGSRVVADTPLFDGFLGRFGLSRIASLEEKGEGELRAAATAGKAVAFLHAPFTDAGWAAGFAESAGLPAVLLGHQCGALPGTNGYLDLLQADVRALSAAISR